MIEMWRIKCKSCGHSCGDIKKRITQKEFKKIGMSCGFCGSSNLKSIKLHTFKTEGNLP